MCPDRDLVSAYVDGEVPSPWRERLEEHLRSCPDCAALSVGYTRLGDRLKAELSGGDEAGALARGRARLDGLLESRSGAAGHVVPARFAFKRSVRLPIPLAVAAAFLVLLLGGTTTILALRPIKGAAIQSVASGELIPQAQPASMDELLQYLEARDGQVTLTIKLPSGTTFGSEGKPVIMRSGQAVRGTPAGGSSP